MRNKKNTKRLQREWYQRNKKKVIERSMSRYEENKDEINQSLRDKTAEEAQKRWERRVDEGVESWKFNMKRFWLKIRKGSNL